MNTASILAIAVGGTLALVALWQVFLTPRLRRGPGGDAGLSLVLVLLRLYAKAVHRLRVEGQEHLEDLDGPLVVVCNHGSPLDPFLIQIAMPRLIRWMMASDQMPADSAMLWEFSRVIPTERFRKSPLAIITAIRELRRGGVVGVFPEGRIGQPTERILPFHEGVGELVARTRARVLLACLQGTPDTDEIGASFFRPSHSNLRFLDVLSWPEGVEPTTITHELRTRIIEATGYQTVDEMDPLPPPVDPFLA